MKLTNVILSVIIATLCTLLFFSKKSNQKKEQTIYNLLVLNDTIRTYKTKLGQTVKSMKTLLVKNKEIEKQVYIKDSLLNDLGRKFKNIQSAVIVKTTTEFDTIKIRYDSLINYKFIRPFTQKKKWHTISGVSTNEGLTISKLTAPINIRMISGKKSNWFKNKYTTDIVVDNPNVTVTEIQNQVVSERKKRFVIGLGGMYGYDKKFSFGVFAGYALSRF